MKGREIALTLRGSYEMSWREYSTDGGDQNKGASATSWCVLALNRHSAAIGRY
jgi:hypothetical protein